MSTFDQTKFLESDDLYFHSLEIERLRKMDAQEIYKQKLSGLIQSVKNQELSLDDVLLYTNISRSQLLTLLDESLEPPTLCP